MSEGLRYNEGKQRWDLLHPVAQEGIVRVLTKGAEKYALRNWEKGMAWSKVISSLKRHLAAIERGEDYDLETGELHIDHLQCNAHFLSAYYKIYPQGDDRPHKYLNTVKIGLDIDEVIADFVGAMMERFPKMEMRSVYWNDPLIMENFGKIANDESFWLGIKPRISHDDLPFEPCCYITSRPISTEITKQWLDNNGFPVAKIYTIKPGESKVQIARASGLSIFVDDRYENFVDLNRAGICCFLMDAVHNQRYNVGFKRIKSLKELVQ